MTPDLESLRAEMRSWLEASCPMSMRTPYDSEEDICWGGRKWVFRSEDQRVWLERAVRRGLTAPAWPRVYGGGGLSSDATRIFEEEMERIAARRPLDNIFGLKMIGPALLEFGTGEQKQQHLPGIVRGEIRWCQGYSEPGAGSDLASLRTRAEDRGDHYLVNGAKVWTSGADQADWIFCLVRTDPAAPKHRGISMLLFDMQSEGVSTRPIRLISGESPFCEVRFENVRVPKGNLLGELNGGWPISRYLLSHERASIGDLGRRGGQSSVHARAVELLGLDAGRLSDGFLRSRIAQYEMDAAAFELTMLRVREEAQAGQSIGAKSSLLKYYGTELNKIRHELLMDIEGCDALQWSGEGSRLCRLWLRSRGNSIEGGTSEIQLGIIAKRILELPA